MPTSRLINALVFGECEVIHGAQAAAESQGVPAEAFDPLWLVASALSHVTTTRAIDWYLRLLKIVAELLKPSPC